MHPCCPFALPGEDADSDSAELTSEGGLSVSQGFTPATLQQKVVDKMNAEPSWPVSQRRACDLLWISIAVNKHHDRGSDL